ncbi:hypothetical protein [Puia sp.]|jgi:predicted ABC-type ATPase|uniref:hypothetical protein n=1 Tax=Puia sp. TaxID=2045100 RepID=UPI002F42DACC
MPNLYIIAGCNGAGKTTASFTILPEMLNCREFVNADSIAAGLSPFNPESVAIEAGRIMIMRINELLVSRVDFAFETTLATRSYLSLVKKAQRVPACDRWIVINNKTVVPELVAKGTLSGNNMIQNHYIWDIIISQSTNYGTQ